MKIGIAGWLDSLIKESVETSLKAKGLYEEVSPDDPDYESIKSGEVSVDDLIDELNIIRSGRSFKDEKIKAALDQYIQKLEAAERSTLLTYIKAIGQIVTGVIVGAAAPDPSEPPANVSQEKTGGPKKVEIKPVIVKNPSTSKGAEGGKPAGVENTTAPLPVVPKTKQ